MKCRYFMSNATKKHSLLFVVIGLFLIGIQASFTHAQSKIDFKAGFMVMIGGRYDNLRMCVATDSGVKGGPIADVMFTGRAGISDKMNIGFNLPVMRPILFAAAFKMLQFEPEMVFDFHSKPKNGLQFTTAPSLGISLHYGPDYHSDLKVRSPSFFAAGPIVGTHFIVGKISDQGLMKHSFGIKPFYASLFSKNHPIGTVVGGALEYFRLF